MSDFLAEFAPQLWALICGAFLVAGVRWDAAALLPAVMAAFACLDSIIHR